MKTKTGRPPIVRPKTGLSRPQSQLIIHKVDFRSLLSGLSPETLRNPLLVPRQELGLVPRRQSRRKLQRTPSEVPKRKKELAISTATISRAKPHGLLTTHYSHALTQRCGSARPDKAERFSCIEEKTRVSEDSSILVDKQQLEAALMLQERKSIADIADVGQRDELLFPQPAARLIHSALSTRRRTAHFQPQSDEFVLKSVPLASKPQSSTARLYFHPRGDIVKLPGSEVASRPRTKSLKKTKTVTSLGTQTNEFLNRREKVEVFLPDDFSEWQNGADTDRGAIERKL